MKRRLAQLLLLPLACVLSGTSQADLSQDPAVATFVSEMSSRHDFDANELSDLFRRVEVREDILRAISRPAESKPWYEYRPIFVTDSRIDQGVEFWRKHARTLARAETEYGVPAPIIVAILGVETRYGRHSGGYRVMDALATLGFAYPPRAGFFRGQLEEYLLMAREEAFDPMELTGSYAGAMGQPQFIPSSFRSYAVDFDGDGHRDLWHSVEDVVGSVANYFARHHWRPGAPIATPARVTGARAAELAERGYKPSVPVSELAEWGVEPERALPRDAEVALLALETPDGLEHWVALHNFYVITRYNHSALYAMAAFQLAEGIRARYMELLGAQRAG